MKKKTPKNLENPAIILTPERVQESTSRTEVQRVTSGEHLKNDQALIAAFLFNRPQTTRLVYEYELSRFRQYTQEAPLRLIKFDELEGFLKHLEAQGLSPSSVARAAAVLKSLYRLGHRLGYFRSDLGALLRGYRAQRRIHERFAEAAKIRSLIAEEREPRNRLILHLLYVGALRVSELRSLNWNSLKIRNSEGILTVLGKGSKRRAIVLPREMVNKLKAVRGDAADTDPIFRSEKSKSQRMNRTTLWRIVKKACLRVGLHPGFSPHWLRHSHATHALENGAPLNLVQQTLGHSSIATTGLYLHARPQESSSLYLRSAPRASVQKTPTQLRRRKPARRAAAKPAVPIARNPIVNRVAKRAGDPPKKAQKRPRKAKLRRNR